jgi:hypothetical protein
LLVTPFAQSETCIIWTGQLTGASVIPKKNLQATRPP